MIKNYRFRLYLLWIYSVAIGIGQEATQTALFGGHRTKGCLGSAGYTFCESQSRCLRWWEEFETIEAFETTCSNADPVGE